MPPNLTLVWSEAPGFYPRYSMRLCPGHLQINTNTHNTTSTVTPPHFLLFMAPGAASNALQAWSHLLGAEPNLVEALEEEYESTWLYQQDCPDEVAFGLKGFSRQMGGGGIVYPCTFNLGGIDLRQITSSLW